MPWGFAAVAAASIGGALISSSASQSAAQTQANAANNATDTQSAMFNQTEANLAPYLQSGNNSLAALQSYLGLGANGSLNPNAPGLAAFSGGAAPTYTAPTFTMPTAGQYQQSPGYQFQMQQGINAVGNSAAAQGGVNSGNTLKALTQYGQGLANQDYQQFVSNDLTAFNTNAQNGLNQYNAQNSNYWNAYNAYVNNQNSTFNKLQTLAGSGQGAAAGLGGLSANVGSTIGNNIIGAGNALAAGQIGSANAFTGALNGTSNNLTQLAFLNQMNPSLFGGSNSSLSPALQAQASNPDLQSVSDFLLQ